MPIVYYTQAAPELAGATTWERVYRWLLDSLPLPRRARLERIRHRTTRVDSATGLLLLCYAMRDTVHPDFALGELVFPDNNGKPFCPGRCDFNISHSHAAVFCALAGSGRVGVDVERIRPIKPHRFERVISPEELKTAGGSEKAFFTCWTQKEAVVKAQGESGVWHLPEVRIEGRNARFKGENWYLYPLTAPSGYAAALACEHPADKPDCRYIEFGQLVHNLIADTEKADSQPR